MKRNELEFVIIFADAQTPTATESADSYTKTGKLWTWFLDMQRTLSHLVGRLVGGMIRGVPAIPEEHFCQSWLTSHLLSHGLESIPVPLGKSMLLRMAGKNLN